MINNNNLSSNVLNQNQLLFVLDKLRSLKIGQQARFVGNKSALTLKNKGFNAEDVKNNAEIVSGGINPSIAMASLIANKPYIYQYDFFGKKAGKSITLNDYIKTENKIDSVATGQGGYNGFFEKAYFKLMEDPVFFKDKKEAVSIFGGQVGNQIPQMNLTQPSENPRYAAVNNIPVSIGLTINQYENQRNIQLFGYDVAENRQRALMESIQSGGIANACMTLFGDSNRGWQGLFNNNAISTLDALDVGHLGFTGGVKTITDISRNVTYLNIFLSKLKALVAGSRPEDFETSTSYAPTWYKQQQMEDPVLIIPRSDYNQIIAVSTANGGMMQWQENIISRIESEIGVEIIPSPFVDSQADSKFAIDGLYNTANEYILYDRAKFHTYITSNIGELSYDSTSYAGIQKDIIMLGSRTDVFSFEKIAGFKWTVSL